MTRAVRLVVGVLSAPRGTRFRIAFCLVLAAFVVGRPAPLQPLRWWRSPPVVKALSLSGTQLHIIEQLYAETLPAQRRSTERLVDTINHVSRLIKEGNYGDDMLRQTEEVARATAEERALSLKLNDAAVSVLSPTQRQTLTLLLSDRGAQ